MFWRISLVHDCSFVRYDVYVVGVTPSKCLQLTRARVIKCHVRNNRSLFGTCWQGPPEKEFDAPPVEAVEGKRQEQPRVAEPLLSPRRLCPADAG